MKRLISLILALTLLCGIFAVSAWSAVAGDINGDGKFSYLDVSKLYAVYRGLAEPAEGAELDINGDGSFTYLDVSKLYAMQRGYIDVTVTEVNGNVSISWEAISGVTTYTIRYKKATASSWISINTTSTSKIISGLDKNVDYIFSVTSDDGRISNEITIKVTGNDDVVLPPVPF